MKKEPEKYKYFKTLRESIKLAFDNPKVFVPHALLFVMFFLLTIFTIFFGTEEGYPTKSMGLFITIIAVTVLLSIFLAGWVLAILNEFMVKNKFTLKSSFKRAFSFTGRSIGVTVIRWLG